MNQIQYQVHVIKTVRPDGPGNTWFEMTQNSMGLIGSAQRSSLRLGLKLLEAFFHVSLVRVEVGDLLMEQRRFAIGSSEALFRFRSQFDDLQLNRFPHGPSVVDPSLDCSFERLNSGVVFPKSHLEALKSLLDGLKSLLDASKSRFDSLLEVLKSLVERSKHSD
jgi:hypothetical protein